MVFSCFPVQYIGYDWHYDQTQEDWDKVYMYECMYVCMYVCMRILARDLHDQIQEDWDKVCMYACMYVCMYVNTSTRLA